MLVMDYEHVQNDCRGFFGPNFELQHFCQRSKFVEVKMMPEVRAKILTATVSQLTTLNAAFKDQLGQLRQEFTDSQGNPRRFGYSTCLS